MKHETSPVERVEATLSEIWHAVASTGFPTFGIPIFGLVMIGVALVGLFILYTLTAKDAGGRDSHAGREQTRRAYRNALARYMAKEDSEKIKRGEKVRRRWMQW